MPYLVQTPLLLDGSAKPVPAGTLVDMAFDAAVALLECGALTRAPTISSVEVVDLTPAADQEVTTGSTEAAAADASPPPPAADAISATSKKR